MKTILKTFIATSFALFSIGVNAQNTVVTDTFIVCGNCYTCKVRIHGELNKLSGINTKNWDYNETLLITYDKAIITPAVFLKAIADVGHDNEMFQATKDSYSKLIGTCCEYDRWLTYAKESGDFTVKGTAECASYIEEKLKEQHGIVSGSWTDMKINTEFYSQVTSPDKILNLLALSGFDNEKYTATDEAYQQLPEGCKYRNASSKADNFDNKQTSVYPNPARDYIVVSNVDGNTTYSIFDFAGKHIRSLDASKRQFIGDLNPGVYYIVSDNESSPAVTRFIKE